MTIETNKILNAHQLKLIALLTMTLDHVYKIFAYDWAPGIGKLLHISEAGSILLITAVFGIGSATIYIFMWFIAEGCRYTHDKRAYLLRLILFGVIAEIPFQLMIRIIGGEPLGLHFGLTNVMFTLALGAAACFGYQKCREKGLRFLCIAIPVVCAGLAYVLKTDYDWFGVVGIFFFYRIQDRHKRLIVLALLAVFHTCLVMPLIDIQSYGFSLDAIPFYIITLLYSLVSVPLLSLYHGQQGKRMKYLFYLYYPLHISVLVSLYLLI